MCLRVLPRRTMTLGLYAQTFDLQLCLPAYIIAAAVKVVSSCLHVVMSILAGVRAGKYMEVCNIVLS